MTKFKKFTAVLLSLVMVVTAMAMFTVSAGAESLADKSISI